jgi:hypothetical protein
MKNFTVCLLAALAINGSVTAALPPLWQNVAELKAIFADKNLGDHLDSGDAIIVIKKTEKGWLFVTNHHELPVHVINKDSTTPGPVQFDIEYGKTHARSQVDE